ncbi:MAG TPA: nucleotide kinase, partial [Mesotoga sp.]|nr:nucleotide kinase [Mesotoga sp.]
MKFFITGERNSGKSYLVERVKALAKFTGFETRFDEDLVDLFISFFNGNSFLIGSRDNGRLKMVDEGFSSAAKLLGAIEIPSDHLLIMDE